MATWPAKDISEELLKEADAHGPQIILADGRQRSVVLSIDDYRRLIASRAEPAAETKQHSTSFKDWLLNGPKLENDDPFFAALERDPTDTGRDLDLE